MYTLSPFFMYFSAMSASPEPCLLLFQHTTRCHSVFSCFSPPGPVHCRLVASDRLATRDPLLVLRTSGSAPKLPIRMTLFRLRLTAASGLRAAGAKDAPHYMTRKSFCQSKIRHLYHFYADVRPAEMAARKTIASSTGRR